MMNKLRAVFSVIVAMTIIMSATQVFAQEASYNDAIDFDFVVEHVFNNYEPVVFTGAIDTATSISPIYYSALAGTLVENENLQVVLMGNIDGMYDVVEITEVLSRITTRSGDSFEGMALTRIGTIRPGDIGYGPIYVGALGIRIQGRIYYDRVTVNGVGAGRVTRGTVSTTVLDPQHRVNRIHGNIGNMSPMGFTPNFASIINVRDSRNFDVHSGQMSINTGFSNFAQMGWNSHFGLNATIEYQSRNSNLRYTLGINVTTLP